MVPLHLKGNSGTAKPGPYVSVDPNQSWRLLQRLTGNTFEFYFVSVDLAAFFLFSLVKPK